MYHTIIVITVLSVSRGKSRLSGLRSHNNEPRELWKY